MISGIFTCSVQEQHVFGAWEEEIVHLAIYFTNIQFINHIKIIYSFKPWNLEAPKNILFTLQFQCQRVSHQFCTMISGWLCSGSQSLKYLHEIKDKVKNNIPAQLNDIKFSSTQYFVLLHPKTEQFHI